MKNLNSIILRVQNGLKQQEWQKGTKPFKITS